MATVKINPIQYPMAIRSSSTTNVLVSSASTYVIDGTNADAIFVICQAPKAGNISNIKVAILDYVATGDIECRIETVASTGTPSGTLWATNTNAVQTISSSGKKTYTLTASATVTRTSEIAIVFQKSGTYTGNIGIGRGSVSNNRTSFPTGGKLLGSTYTISVANAPVNLLIGYDDGTYYRMNGWLGVLAEENISLDSDTSPDEAGNVFIPDFGCTCNSISTILDTNANTLTLKVYDSVNTELDSITIDATKTAAWSSTGGQFVFNTNTELTFNGGATYRMVVVRSGATGTNTSLGSMNSETEAELHATTHGTMYLTSRTDAGAWTDTTTKMAYIFPHIDGVVIPSGGGSYIF